MKWLDLRNAHIVAYIEHKLINWQCLLEQLPRLKMFHIIQTYTNNEWESIMDCYDDIVSSGIDYKKFVLLFEQKRFLKLPEEEQFLIQEIIYRIKSSENYISSCESELENERANDEYRHSIIEQMVTGNYYEYNGYSAEDSELDAVGGEESALWNID